MADHAETTAPVGTVFVASDFVVNGPTMSLNLKLVAISYKRDDGWYWAEYNADGDSNFSGL